MYTCVWNWVDDSCVLFNYLIKICYEFLKTFNNAKRNNFFTVGMKYNSEVTSDPCRTIVEIYRKKTSLMLHLKMLNMAKIFGRLS